MKYAEEYCAVGTAIEKDAESCVVVFFSGTIIRLPEHLARKLADDILRNANYLWPIKEDKHD
jgi:hypothetical protein